MKIEIKRQLNSMTTVRICAYLDSTDESILNKTMALFRKNATSFEDLAELDKIEVLYLASEIAREDKVDAQAINALISEIIRDELKRDLFHEHYKFKDSFQAVEEYRNFIIQTLKECYDN